MGKHSGVDWCDYSHGFWYGCRKVSPGCLNCYAERNMKRFGQDFNTVTRAKGFSKPLSWKESGRVFVCPHSDFFIEDADEWRGEAWEIMRRTPHLTYLILTKRPENIIYRLPVDWMGEYLYGGGYDNVWLGVTAENQEMANKRIPILLQIPAVVRFVSCEPLLSDIDLCQYLNHESIRGKEYERQTETRRCLGDKGNVGQPANDASCDGEALRCISGHNQRDMPAKDLETPSLNWCIIGGESGPNARPMQEEWASDLLDQCRAAGVAFFMKQIGGRKPIPEYLNVREFPNTGAVI